MSPVIAPRERERERLEDFWRLAYAGISVADLAMDIFPPPRAHQLMRPLLACEEFAPRTANCWRASWVAHLPNPSLQGGLSPTAASTS